MRRRPWYAVLSPNGPIPIRNGTLLSPSQKRSLAWLLHAPRSRPQFIAYSVKDLPAAPPLMARALFGLPLLTWTVRTEENRRRAARWADQIIFEGWRP